MASTCALNVATAWLGLTQEFERLSKRSDPPAEIERLVNEVVDSGSLMGPVFIPSLRECLDGQSMEDPIAYLSACEFEAKMVIGEGERLAKSLAAWEPYL